MAEKKHVISVGNISKSREGKFSGRGGCACGTGEMGRKKTTRQREAEKNNGGGGIGRKVGLVT